MHLDHIELSKLVISSANMRAKHKARDIADLIPSIRARGVLTPLLVRPNGAPDIYEIVAGRRRYFAAKAVSEASGEAMALPCAIMEPGDDAAALEASLLENVARLDPDEVSRWETFARLIKDGRSVEDIASTFALPDTAVRRVLALGNLVPRILALYRSQKVDAGTVRALTLAMTTQQRAWLALFESEDDYAPTGRALKAWLFGGDAIPTSSALFDLAEYTSPIVSDLFDEGSYFSDSALFWSLQSKAIAAKKQSLIDAGWNDVVVLDEGRWFDRWAYEKRPKAKGGRVYIAVGDGGAVEIHEGYLPRKEAERRDRAEKDQVSVARPELTAPLRRYLDLHRHAAVRAALLDHSLVALRLMLAHAVAGSPLWKVELERQYAEKAETRKSVAESHAETVFSEQRLIASQKLHFDPEQAPLAHRQVPLTDLFEKLRKLPDEDVLALVSVVMGATLYAGDDCIEVVGTTLEVDISATWHADEAFFSLLRDRLVLGELVAEIAGTQTARANSEAPSKILKGIIRDCLNGENGRTKVENWVPRWLRFPSSQYLTEEPDPASPDSDDTADPIEASAKPEEATELSET